MGITEGTVVRRKGFKTRATVVRVLDNTKAEVNWRGWVEVDPPLGAFKRWPVDALEVVREAPPRS